MSKSSIFYGFNILGKLYVLFVYLDSNLLEFSVIIFFTSLSFFRSAIMISLSFKLYISMSLKLFSGVFYFIS